MYIFLLERFFYRGKTHPCSSAPPSCCPNAGVGVYLGQQRCSGSYSLEMFFCLSKAALVYVSEPRDVCRRQRHSSRREVCFVRLHTLQGARDAARGVAAKREPELRPRCCHGTSRSFSSESRPRNTGWNPPWQPGALQDGSDRGEPGSKSTEAVTTPNAQVCLTPGRSIYPQLLELRSQKGIASINPPCSSIFIQNSISFLIPSLSPPCCQLPTCSRQHCGCWVGGTFQEES